MVVGTDMKLGVYIDIDDFHWNMSYTCDFDHDISVQDHILFKFILCVGSPYRLYDT